MFSLNQKFCQWYVDAWLKFFAWRNPQVRFGDHICLRGMPIFSFEKDANVNIGNNVTFTSDPKVNLVGLTKPCSLAVESGAHLSIGDGSGFSGVSIYCTTKIVIGARMTCGGNVSIWDTDFHPIQAEERRNNSRSKIVRKPIVIGDDVFIGANALVLKGVTIGNGSTIGAGSVVTRNVPSLEVWAGNPARFVKNLSVS